MECQERSDGESKVVSGAGPGGKLSGGSASGGLLVFNSNVEQASVIWFVSRYNSLIFCLKNSMYIRLNSIKFTFNQI